MYVDAVQEMYHSMYVAIGEAIFALHTGSTGMHVITNDEAITVHLMVTHATSSASIITSL